MKQRQDSRGTWELFSRYASRTMAETCVRESGRECEIGWDIYTPDPNYPGVFFTNWQVWMRLLPGEERLPVDEIEQRIPRYDP